MTTLNDQRMEAKTLFEDYKGVSDTFSEMNSTRTIINELNSKLGPLKRKYEFVGDNKAPNPKDGTVASMKKKFIDAHMKTAEVYAELSSAKKLHVGCVVVKDNTIIGKAKLLIETLLQQFRRQSHLQLHNLSRGVINAIILA